MKNFGDVAWNKYRGDAPLTFQKKKKKQLLKKKIYKMD